MQFQHMHDFKLKLKQTDQIDEKEGIFIILNKFPTHTFEATSNKLLLTGDIEKCRPIHQTIVERLESDKKQKFNNYNRFDRHQQKPVRETRIWFYLCR